MTTTHPLAERPHAREHLTHTPVMTAQDLAAAEHVSGRHVAKPVVVKLDGQLAMAVVAASERVNLAALEEALGVPAELAAEQEFAERFAPCEAGADGPAGSGDGIAPRPMAAIARTLMARRENTGPPCVCPGRHRHAEAREL